MADLEEDMRLLFNATSSNVPTIIERKTDYTVDLHDGDNVNGVTIECTAGPFTLTLYPVDGQAGRKVNIANTSGATITIRPNRQEKIAGAASYSLLTGKTVRLMVNAGGNAWIVLGGT